MWERNNTSPTILNDLSTSFFNFHVYRFNYLHRIHHSHVPWLKRGKTQPKKMVIQAILDLACPYNVNLLKMMVQKYWWTRPGHNINFKSAKPRR